MTQYDVVVIGGGPAGMMAAIQSGKQGYRTLLIDKNNELGKKLQLTGGGRCNVTNNCSNEELLENIPRNSRFLYSAFHQFSTDDIITFFTTIGVVLKEEDHGRMFPTTNSAHTIVDGLRHQIANYSNITIKLSCSVTSIMTQDNQLSGVLLDSREKVTCQKVIIATGGKSYPQTGSTGDGYKFAKQVGHTIQPLHSAEAPLISNDTFVQDKSLQGLTLNDVKVSILKPNGKIYKTFQHSLLFTHFGLSGPAALRCSYYVNDMLSKDKKVWIAIDALPNASLAGIEQDIIRRRKISPDKSVLNALSQLVPQRYLTFLLHQLKINEQLPIKQLSNEDFLRIAQQLKNFRIQISGTWPLAKAFVTAGGISVKEINPKTMESKRLKGLFFAGEVLDVNAHTGGFNVTVALSTGFVAGSTPLE